MKKIMLAFCLFSTISVFADTPITSKEIRIALGKTIYAQEDMKQDQEFFRNEIKSLKKSLIELKHEVKDLRRQEITTSNSIEINEEMVTTAYFSNIREKPTFDSKIIKQVPLCSKLKIKECSINTHKEVWCGLKYGGYIRRYLLSFNKIQINLHKEFTKTSKEEDTNRINQLMVILGVSQDGRWACFADGSKVSTRNLGITNFN